MYIVKHYAEKIFYVEKCISNPDKYLMHLNEIDKNTNSYNKSKGINYWHPGYAWACTRKAYEKMGGLYELSV